MQKTNAKLAPLALGQCGGDASGGSAGEDRDGA